MTPSRQVTINELLAALHRLAPLSLAAPWDNPGLQVGDLRAPVERALVALDAGCAQIEEAASLGCQALVTHHPLIFEPVKSVRLDEPLGAALALAVRSGVAVIAAHTNLDAAAWGVNDVLAEALELEDAAPLEPSGGPGEGLGRVGRLPRAMALSELATLCRERLSAAFVRCVEGRGGSITRVAVCGGSGGSLMAAALAAGADAFVTGDIRYHQARECQGRIALIDCGHFQGERPVLSRLAARLSSELAGRVDVRLSTTEQDPFKLY
jgi:dinuclear metal center YbgI/SA1388 family protein